MKKIIILAPFIALLFSFNVNAAQSSHTVNFTDQDGNTLNVRYQDHSTVDPSGYFEEHNANGQVTGYTYTWDISENIDIILTQGKYYTGYVTTRLTWASNISGISLSDATINNTNTTEGIYVYISTISSNYIQIQWVFDNYYTSSAATLGTATLDLKFTYRGTLTSPYLNITNTVTSNNNLRGYAGVQNNALTAMIFSALEQATDTDLQNIISLLTTIKNQDYTYYNQIINELGVQGQLHYDFTTVYAVLVGLQHNVQDGFEDVQTILDLFPSYRTQVLQYWQQLLEMNAAQASTADEIQENYSNAESNADQMAGQLGSVDLPSISSGNLNILGSVDSTQKNNFFGMLSIITHTEVVTKIMLIIVIGAMVGFILYGKKGG